MYCYEAVHQQSRRDGGIREVGRRIQGHSQIYEGGHGRICASEYT